MSNDIYDFVDGNDSQAELNSFVREAEHGEAGVSETGGSLRRFRFAD